MYGYMYCTDGKYRKCLLHSCNCCTKLLVHHTLKSLQQILCHAWMYDFSRFPSSLATTSCKQLEGEKTLLEEQLKTQNSRRQGRRSQASSRRSSIQNQTLHDRDKSLAASLGSENQPPASSQGPGTQSPSNTEATSSAASASTAPGTSTTGSQPKRPINILEDLDKEFNKLKLEQGARELSSSLPQGRDPKRVPASTSLLEISSDVAVHSEVAAMSICYSVMWVCSVCTVLTFLCTGMEFLSLSLPLTLSLVETCFHKAHIMMVFSYSTLI